MNSILDYFSDWKAEATMQVEQRSTLGYDSTTGKSTNQKTWTPVTGLTAVPIWFYEKSAASVLVDDRIKNRATAAIVVDPRDLSSTVLNDKMRGVVDGKIYYFLDPDNIMKLGEVIVLGVSEVDNA